MYAVAGWVLIQIGEVTFEPLGLPEGSLRTLILAVAMGFPVAVILGWLYDWTSGGIVRTSEDRDTEATAPFAGGLRGRLLATLAVVLLFGFAYGGFRAYDFWTNVRWAQDVAQPELAARIAVNDFAGAFALATQIEKALGETPALEPVWKLISAHVEFETEPAGALVSYRSYADLDGEWTSLGETPVATVRVPRGPSLWRIEKPGYVTRTLARSPVAIDIPQFQWPAHYVLDPAGSQAGDTIPVEAREYLQVPLGGFPVGGRYELERFFIDRTEVRNDQYQEFVDAGGYQRAEYWTEPFGDGGDALEFEDAMLRFVDSSGRTGPATWIGGRHPDGQAAHPVGGVSWYEAMAYARFRGRALPTVYHWGAAALPDVEILEALASSLAAQSNLESEGTVPVGTTPGVSAVGAADMFGNVAEWVSTARGNERFILGLGWSDPAYMASLPAAASPWSRLPAQGLRLASYPDGEMDPTLLAPVDISFVDYESLEPASEDVIDLLIRRPDAASEPVVASDRGVELPNGLHASRVEVKSSVSGPPLPLFVLAPENAKPPYRTIVWFGGINALVNRDNQTLYDADMSFAKPLLQSGSMVVMPLWTGTFERNDGTTFGRFMGDPADQQELMRAWIRDLRLTVDYLATRDDVAADRIAFVGLSLGAAVGNWLVPSEERFRTAIFWSGGFTGTSLDSGAALAAGLASRIEIPVLMLNGRHDFIFPFELQQSFFRLLGTPAEHKRHVVYDGGHFGWPLGEFARENLDWLDRYLGPAAK